MNISDLPKEIRAQAEAERTRQRGKDCSVDKLSWAFEWHKSPQLWDYWHEIDKGERPPIHQPLSKRREVEYW